MGLVEHLRKSEPGRADAMDTNAKPMKTTSLIPGRGRRAAMRALAGGAALVAGRALAQRDDMAARAPACVLTPQQTEGPYFVDERLERVDIRSDPASGTMRAGAPLALLLRLSTIRGSRCEPLSGAIVDVWHCDAGGVYSDVDDPSLRTKGTAFLRGYQLSGANGQVRFVRSIRAPIADAPCTSTSRCARTAAAAFGNSPRSFTSTMCSPTACTNGRRMPACAGRATQTTASSAPAVAR
jgi:protocatechuate 3,4-dioxygenase beta subunit